MIMDNLRPLALRVARVMLLFYASAAAAQPTALTLDSCHALARRHYPLIHQFNLIGASEGFSLQNANKGYLPQVALAGHATYQSDVTSLPIAISSPMNPPRMRR